MDELRTQQDLRSAIYEIVDRTPVLDIHTHLYTPDSGDLLLWGVDELVTYHYLIAELFRKARGLAPERFWQMTKKQQADTIWQALFVDNSPVSEACRGVLTVLQALGHEDLRDKTLDDIRPAFEARNVSDYMDEVMEKAGVRALVMTNDPFDEKERSVWLKRPKIDPRFKAALRVDALLVQYQQEARARLKAWGYNVEEDLAGESMPEIQRFLNEWIDLMRPVYLAVSLPWSFRVPEDSDTARLIESAVLPVCRQRNLPLALMIGVKRLLNPRLRVAGDGVGRADLAGLEYLLVNYPDSKFLVTLLSRENQHELCVLARKFPNLMIFGCWWFLNDPSIIQEMTRERLELLGLSFIPQHSDARVLDQLIYKWGHFRQVLKPILLDKYRDILQTGWRPTRADIQRDVEGLFGGVFEAFVA